MRPRGAPRSESKVPLSYYTWVIWNIYNHKKHVHCFLFVMFIRWAEMSWWERLNEGRYCTYTTDWMVSSSDDALVMVSCNLTLRLGSIINSQKNMYNNIIVNTFVLDTRKLFWHQNQPVPCRVNSVFTGSSFYFIVSKFGLVNGTLTS